MDKQAAFNVGQLVKHSLFQYRGVVIDVDAEFMLSDEWYELMAKSQPPKDAPWYRVLVHDSEHETYVAERNLEASENGSPINNPGVNDYFSGFKDGSYILDRSHAN